VDVVAVPEKRSSGPFRGTSVAVVLQTNERGFRKGRRNSESLDRKHSIGQDFSKKGGKNILGNIAVEELNILINFQQAQ